VIDERAVVSAGAKIGKHTSIGAYSIIGPSVVIGDNCWIGPHVVINGTTEIGNKVKIYQFCSIGDAPQHLSYKNEPTELIIGNDNVFREYVTINRGTVIG
jgi:UDP-N-acetylglucosamine acyltransferase